MRIHINKNGQQHESFDSSKVIKMLHDGQLLPNDLGAKDGRESWQKSGKMFPQSNQAARILLTNQPSMQVNRRFTSAPQKSRNSQGMMFRLIGCSSLILLSVIGLVGCSRSSDKSSKDIAATNKTASPVPTDFTVMKNKAEELAKLSPPLKFNPTAKVKGKVAWVQKGNSSATMNFFDDYNKKISNMDVDYYGLTEKMVAYKPEEIDTLIQTICSKGKIISRYEGGIIGYANNCKVSLIDYKGNVIFAQKTIINSKPEASVPSIYASEKEYTMPEPTTKIRDYVTSLIPEKFEVSVESLPKIEDPTEFAKAANQFAKLLFPVKLDSNSKIKGKVVIAYNDLMLIDGSSSSSSSLIGIETHGGISSPKPNLTTLNKDILTKEGLGIADNQIALKSSEIETLIQVSCKRGTPIAKVKGVSFFSYACIVDVIDYKALVTVAQKTFEGKKYETERYIHKDKTSQADFPRDEIHEYIKNFPRG
jgi:hypothetical protein